MFGLEFKQSSFPIPEKNKTPEKLPEQILGENIINRVEELYRQRSNNQTLIDCNTKHSQEVLKKALEIAQIIQEKNKNQEIDTEALAVAAALHDIAKFDKSGNIDTLEHNSLDKVEEALNELNSLEENNKSNSGIKKYLSDNNITEESLQFIKTCINCHSSRCKFITGTQRDKEKYPDIDVMEYAILSDADLIDQTEINKGFLKIITFRLTNDKFIEQDTKNEFHDIEATLDSALNSAIDSQLAMSFDFTKEEAKGNVEKIKDFISYCRENKIIEEINQAPKEQKLELVKQAINNYSQDK